MKIALYQMEDRGNVKENIKAAYDAIVKTKADFICFPEFFTIPAEYKNWGKTVEDAWKEISIPTINAIKDASKLFKGYVIAGSVVEKDENKYYNTCFVFKNGEVVAKYRKMNPIDEEIKMGISRGRDVVSIKSKYGRFGILICADCLNSETVEKVGKLNDIVFLPISLTDPSHPKVEGHPVSERIAKEHNIIVAKVSRIAWGNGVKSVVMSPSGIVKEASSCCEEEIVVAEI